MKKIWVGVIITSIIIFVFIFTKDNSLIDNLTLEEKIGQMIIAGIEHKPGDKIATLITEDHISGIIIFKHNYNTAEDLVNLTNKIKAWNKDNPLPLFISMDHEGGRVFNLPEPATHFPNINKLGRLNSKELAFKTAQAIGSELKAMGINLNFAPVLDVNSNPDNPIIGTRSFSSNPKKVAELGIAMSAGFKEANIIPTIKHFPGHGDTKIDSHLNLPSLNYNFNRLKEVELSPFKQAIEAGSELVMVGHIKLNQIDSKFPATLSPKIITNILKEDLNFKGVVITDAMEMGALTKNFSDKEAIINAIKAGNDILLYTLGDERPFDAIKIIKEAVKGGEISEERIDKSVQKIIALKEKYKLKDKKIDYNKAIKVLNNPEHKVLLNNF